MIHFPLFFQEKDLQDWNDLQKNVSTASAVTWREVSGSQASGDVDQADDF